MDEREVCEKVVELFAHSGWCKNAVGQKANGDFCYVDDPEVESYCALGAVQKVTGLAHNWNDRLIYKVMDCLAQLLPDGPWRQRRQYGSDSLAQVVAFNNDPNISKEDVVLLFKEGANA